MACAMHRSIERSNFGLAQIKRYDKCSRKLLITIIIIIDKRYLLRCAAAPWKRVRHLSLFTLDDAQLSELWPEECLAAHRGCGTSGMEDNADADDAVHVYFWHSLNAFPQ